MPLRLLPLVLVSFLLSCSAEPPVFKVADQSLFATSAAFSNLTAAGIVAGASLGQVVASAGDVNGDGKQDLLMAAPAGGVSGEGEVLLILGPAALGPDLVLPGPEPGSAFGMGLAGLGDVDGDGYDDVAIGAPQAFGTGAVFVHLGGPAGLDLAPTYTLVGAASSSFGMAVAGGDVTGDGLADLLVGAPLDSAAGWAAGSVSLYAGGAAGLPANPTDVALGAPLSRTGSTLAVGDVDGDGLMDSVVGGPLASSAAGSVEVWAGTPTGFGPSLGVLTGTQSAEGCGASLAVGDLDDDGLPDVVMGCPFYDVGVEIDAGRLVGWSSTAGGLSGSGTWTEPGTVAGQQLGAAVLIAAWPGTDLVLVAGAPGGAGGVVTVWSVDASGPTVEISTLPASGADSLLGSSLASADLTGDGGPELILGAPGSNMGGANAGAVWTVTGGLLPFESTASVTLTSAIPDSLVLGDFDGDGQLEVASATGAGNTIRWFDGVGQGAGALFTPTWPALYVDPTRIILASGDLDGDGDDELVAGAYEAGGGATKAGAIKVYDGDASAPLSAEWTTVAVPGAVAGRGWSVSIGDLNGDGFDDLVGGAPGTGPPAYWSFYPGYGSGAVEVWYGGSSNLPLQPDWSASGIGSNDNFGYAVAVVPDVHGDGYDDLVVGAPFTAGGTLSLYSGGLGGLAASPDWTISGASYSARLGAGIWGLGDVDGDGFGDIAAYAPDGSSLTGSIGIYRGSTTGLMQTPSWEIEIDRATSWLGIDDRVDVAALFGQTSLSPTCLLVTATPGSGAVRVVYLQPAGDLIEFAIGLPASGTSLAVGDLTGDGATDLARIADSLAVHVGSGTGRVTNLDQLTLLEGESATVLDDGSSSVLSNDLEPGWTATLVRGPLHGALTFDGSGAFSYVHDGSDSTADSWLYSSSSAGVVSQPEIVQITVLPFDDPPLPDAGGPYTVAEMEPLVLDSSGTTDDGPVTILWDCDGDGQPETFDGLPCSWPDDGVRNVLMLVADGGGHTAMDSAVVDVTNTPPVIEPIDQTWTAVQYQSFTLDLDGDDVGPQDPTTWSLSSTPASSASIDPLLGTITWTPQSAGWYELVAMLMDDEGGFDTFLLVIEVESDEDADGMGDAWEVEHGLDPTVDDTAEDPDGDGRPNMQEFLAGTEPDVFDGPTRPAPVSPADGALVMGPPVELRVSAATSPVDAPLTYRVQLYDGDAFAMDVGGLPEIDGTVRFQVLNGLQTDGVWTWRFRAEDPYVGGPWSIERTILVDSVDDPPGRPVVLFPRDGDVFGWADMELYVLFSTVDDPEGQPMIWLVEQVDADGQVLASRSEANSTGYGAREFIESPELVWVVQSWIRVVAEDPGGNRSESDPVLIYLQDDDRLVAEADIRSPDAEDTVSRSPEILYRLRDMEEGGVRVVLDDLPSMDGPDALQLTAEADSRYDRTSYGGFDLASQGMLLPEDGLIYGLLIAEYSDGSAQSRPYPFYFRTDDNIPNDFVGCRGEGCAAVGADGAPAVGLLLLLLVSCTAARRTTRRC